MVENVELSNNFRLYEFLSSDTAERHPVVYQQQFDPPQEVVDNIGYLVQNTLQPLREYLGSSISITSGYRCSALNKLVGGAVTSQHLKGQAADCVVNSVDSNALFRADTWTLQQTGERLRTDVNANFILFLYAVDDLEMLDIDQVIHEYGLGAGRPAWVHISSSRERNSRKILYINRGKNLILDAQQAFELGVSDGF